MYLSDNCEGNTVIGTIFTGQDFRKLEQSMVERELGECVELSVNGKSYIKTFNNSDLQTAYISIDAQKSWIVSKECCGTFCVD